jgi:hypothetical protein
MRDSSDRSENRQHGEGDQDPKRAPTREELQQLSLERILRTKDGMAVWGGDGDYERYST